MTYKDTAHNVRVTEEFTVNIVDHALIEAMNVCAIAFPSDIDEIATAGLTAVPGTPCALSAHRRGARGP
jgi:flavin reductase (DIM6/NTAB) family NADH-FMN oxidoreductase RutF